MDYLQSEAGSSLTTHSIEASFYWKKFESFQNGSQRKFCLENGLSYLVNIFSVNEFLGEKVLYGFVQCVVIVAGVVLVDGLVLDAAAVVNGVVTVVTVVPAGIAVAVVVSLDQLFIAWVLFYLSFDACYD